MDAINLVNKRKKGVLSLEYHKKRIRKGAFRYRLIRRTTEVLINIQRYMSIKINNLLDLGTADGIMIQLLEKEIDIDHPIGIDLSLELLKTNTNPRASFLRSDVENLPIKDQTISVIVAAAVIEHVSDINSVLKECFRVLMKKGIMIITTAHPFYVRTANLIKHIKEEYIELFNLKKLKNLLESNGFKTLNFYKFMISPIGLPAEDEIEKIVRLLHLNFLLMNQLIVVSKE